MNEGCKYCKHLEINDRDLIVIGPLGAYTCRAPQNSFTVYRWYDGRKEVIRKHPSELNANCGCGFFERKEERLSLSGEVQRY